MHTVCDDCVLVLAVYWCLRGQVCAVPAGGQQRQQAASSDLTRMPPCNVQHGGCQAPPQVVQALPSRHLHVAVPALQRPPGLWLRCRRVRVRQPLQHPHVALTQARMLQHLQRRQRAGWAWARKLERRLTGRGRQRCQVVRQDGHLLCRTRAHLHPVRLGHNFGCLHCSQQVRRVHRMHHRVVLPQSARSLPTSRACGAGKPQRVGEGVGPCPAAITVGWARGMRSPLLHSRVAGLAASTHRCCLLEAQGVERRPGLLLSLRHGSQTRTRTRTRMRAVCCAVQATDARRCGCRRQPRTCRRPSRFQSVSPCRTRIISHGCRIAAAALRARCGGHTATHGHRGVQQLHTRATDML